MHKGIRYLATRRFLLPVCLILFFMGHLPCFGALTAERVASGLSRPVYVVSPPGDHERLFVVEQHTGRIKILYLATGEIDPSPFLEIRGLATRNEQGLLGLAFDPNYAENGYFYCNLTVASGGTTELRRYRVAEDDPKQADAESQTLIISYTQPFSNHNGGWIGFGPDGYLYIASGDGGSGNDPGNRAQDLTNQKLGKLLRIDVSHDAFPQDDARNYAIPPDNPFVGLAGDDEIWAFGLRNPWRCSFDRATGDLWIADVGQGQREEVNVQPFDSIGGENYGWRMMEGTRCNRSGDPLPCNDPSLVPPMHEYDHSGPPDGGFSITGGYVYRGPIRSLQGAYFFADYVTEQIWSLRYDGETVTDLTNWTTHLKPEQGRIGEISSFGEDNAGNLFIVDLGGQVFRLVCDGSLVGDFDRDCDVDGSDFALLGAGWRSVEGDQTWNPLVDLVTSGAIDSHDLAALTENWLLEDQELITIPPGRRR